MAETPNAPSNTGKFQLTADWWAVITALVLALLVRVGLVHRVPW